MTKRGVMTACLQVRNSASTVCSLAGATEFAGTKYSESNVNSRVETLVVKALEGSEKDRPPR